MRKIQKVQALEYIKLLEEAHEEIRKSLEKNQKDIALSLLAQCQDGAIQLGEFIESLEGEGTGTVSVLKKYCEILFKEYEEINFGSAFNTHKIYKQLEKQRIQIENSIKNDIKERKEIVFLPYKASMWDSLESIYLAAAADENCDVYVIPIPYYDKNPDGSLGNMHYEGTQYPENIPVIWYENYDFLERQPDVIYIHNPYDAYNYVTSVDPRFYSHELKKYTDCLVYVPYYSTSGGMHEGQALCAAYPHVDYIVMQAEKYRGFFHKSIPREKLVALGSPKFDRIIRMCNQPKQIPDIWKEQMEGKKVYFYNTSINGMLADTESFLKKMAYVFDCFKDKKEACLVWRPHPLLESTFSSLRKELLEEYLRLKLEFLEKEIGIYDDTSDMNKTIALCDVYIGDSATSVTSVFGIAGKPVFILNNRINSRPEEDDWKGYINKGFSPYWDRKWMVTQGNKLYFSPEEDYKYQYNCDLSEYGAGNYYGPVYEIDGKVYVCPLNAQDILVVKDGKIIKKVLLERHLVRPGAFCDAIKMGHKIYLIPFLYPAIVVYDTQKDTLGYIREYQDFCAKNVEGEWRVGGHCIWKNFLIISSPVNNQILAIETTSDKPYLFETRANNWRGSSCLECDGENIWCLPYEGETVICWNPKTGETREYRNIPSNFICKNPVTGQECTDKPFSSIVFDETYTYLSPYLGNQYLRIHKENGNIEKWIPPFPVLEKEKNGYFNPWSKGYFIRKEDSLGNRTYNYFSLFDCRLYDIDLENQKAKEIEIEFSQDDLCRNESGFCEVSEWIQYACEENVINSLEDLIHGTIKGKAHSKEAQIAAYGKIAANNDGTCGEKIHKFICG